MLHGGLADSATQDHGCSGDGPRQDSDEIDSDCALCGTQTYYFHELPFKRDYPGTKTASLPHDYIQRERGTRARDHHRQDIGVP
jgi:hypothetical protein